MSIKRIDRGRGHSYQIDGKKADGVTTLIGDGVPKPALINWAANVTAAAAVDNWAELTDLPPSARLERLKKARWESLDLAGKRGTEVHALAEKLAHGEEVDVPEELAGHVEAAVKFLDDWQIETVKTETVIASRKWMYCGTFDLLAKLPDGRVALCDWKTTRSGIYGEVGLQLAAYANADAYIDADGTEHPMTELGIDCGLAIWIRADGYDVYEVDISEKTFKTFQHVAWLARKLKTLREDAISPALDTPVGAA
jgi:hypothetical protein